MIADPDIDDPAPWEDRPTQPPVNDDAADERLAIMSLLAGRVAWDTVRHLGEHDFLDPTAASAWKAAQHIAQQGDDPTIASVLADQPWLASWLTATGAPARSIGLDAANRIYTRRRQAQALRIVENATAAFRDRVAGRPHASGVPWETELGQLVSALMSLGDRPCVVPGPELEARLQKLTPQPPIPTGIHRLDEFLDGGLRPGTLLAIGSPPKVGKTVLLATISSNLDAAQTPISHLVVSLQTAGETFAALKLGRRTGTSSPNHAGSARPSSVLAYPQPRRPSCTIFHAPGASLEDVETEAAYQVRRHGCRLLMIDYLQKVGGSRPREFDEQHMTRVCDALQRLAVALKIPVIVTVLMDDLGQISRRAAVIKHSATAFLVLCRDRSSPTAYFETQASSLSTEADIGSIDHPALILDPAGPHFRSA